MADATSPLMVAILAILNADPTVQTLCGRTARCAIAWGDLDLDNDPLPILVVEDNGEGGSFLEDSAGVNVVGAAFASGADADTTTGALLAAVEAAVTTTALMNQNIDASVDPTSQPWPKDRTPVRDEGIPDLVQRTIAMAFLITP